jgi:hypothetical protein
LAERHRKIMQKTYFFLRFHELENPPVAQEVRERVHARTRVYPVRTYDGCTNRRCVPSVRCAFYDVCT